VESANEYANESGSENENDCLNWSIYVGDVDDYSNGHRGEIFCDGGDESANGNVDHGVDSVNEHEVVESSAWAEHPYPSAETA
jgi:hypothetical protein